MAASAVTYNKFATTLDSNLQRRASVRFSRNAAANGHPSLLFPGSTSHSTRLKVNIIILQVCNNKFLD